MLVHVYIYIIDIMIRTLFERIGAWTQETVVVLHVFSLFVFCLLISKDTLLGDFYLVPQLVILLIFQKAC